MLRKGSKSGFFDLTRVKTLPETMVQNGQILSIWDHYSKMSQKCQKDSDIISIVINISEIKSNFANKYLQNKRNRYYIRAPYTLF